MKQPVDSATAMKAAVAAWCAEMATKLSEARDLPSLDEAWAMVKGSETEISAARYQILKDVANKRWRDLDAARRAERKALTNRITGESAA